MRLAVCVVVALGIVAAGCGERIKRPGTSDLVLHGTVFQQGGASLDRLGGARVTAAVDRNQNGTIEGDEAVTVTADDEGAYRLQMKVNLGERVVVRFSSEGAADMMRTVIAGPWAEIALNGTLRELEGLGCDGDTCTSEGGGIDLSGLNGDVSGSARVFNPAAEESAFPGGFGDDEGNLLLSGVFGAIELEDGNGPVETLDAPARLRMKVPPETWHLIVDLQPGDDRIQIPMYAFDEVTGQWKREADGVLETTSGGIIPESALASIRDGSFQGGVNTCSAAPHFSFWNLDWPVDTKQCVSGIVLTDEGEEAEGATVYVTGLTYTGRSELETVGGDGRFCTEVMRSEAPGEDVDQNRSLGDTTRVRVRIAYGGALFEAGEHAMPTAPATCGGGCLDLGEIVLRPEDEVKAELCTLRGRVVDGRSGQPVEGVVVFGGDPGVPDEAQKDLCGFGGLACTIIPPFSDGEGRFELTLPVLDGAMLFAFHSSTDGSMLDSFRSGVLTTKGCPSGEFTLVMNDGYDRVDVQVSATGQVISWTPAGQPIHELQVINALGETTWHLTSETGFTGPVTVGTVPPGAQQAYPAPGVPPTPLASGHHIWIEVNGDVQNIRQLGESEFTVP